MNRSYSRTIVWMVWTIASLFYAYQYILRVMPSIMLDDIMQRFQIDAATFGQFSGVYYIGYSLMHLPIGILLDRVGPKKIMTASILLTVLGLMPLVFAEHWVYPILGRILIGMGSSAAILGVFKIIRMLFAEKLFPRMLSFSVTIGLIGAIYGGGPVSYMKDHFGFEIVSYMFAAAGIVLALATYWIVPNGEAPAQTSVFSDVKEVLRNKKVIGTCLMAGMMVGPLEGFADVWGTSFLKQVYGFDGSLSASLPSIIFIGMCFGAPVLTWIADKIGSYLSAIIGAGIAMAILFLLFLSFSVNQGILTVGFAVIGICCAYQILAIYKASTYVREQVAGLTTAVANMIIMFFGYAFHSAIGGIVNAMGGPAQPNALIFGLSVIPLGLFIGIAGFTILFTQEKRTSKELRHEASI